MFDATPLTLEEVTDQCRALAHAVIELEDVTVKEILSFMLAERLEHLHISLAAEEHNVNGGNIRGTL